MVRKFGRLIFNQRNRLTRRSFNNLMVGDESLSNISNRDPEFSLYSFSWGVAIFTVFTFVALVFVAINAVIEQQSNPGSKSLWWQYLLIVILTLLDIYCMVQCKLEIIHLCRDRGLVTVVRKGLNLKKNYCVQIGMHEIVEMHIQETRKKVGDTAHDYSKKFKLCLQLSNGDIITTMTTHDQNKASNDLHLILKFIESCKQTQQLNHALSRGRALNRVETEGTSSTLDINVIDHTRNTMMDDTSSYLYHNPNRGRQLTRSPSSELQENCVSTVSQHFGKPEDIFNESNENSEEEEKKPQMEKAYI